MHVSSCNKPQKLTRDRPVDGTVVLTWRGSSMKLMTFTKTELTELVYLPELDSLTCSVGDADDLRLIRS